MIEAALSIIVLFYAMQSQKEMWGKKKRDVRETERELKSERGEPLGHEDKKKISKKHVSKGKLLSVKRCLEQTRL